MRILQIVGNFSPKGGQERYVWELAHALATRGHEVTVFCKNTSTSPYEQAIRVHCHPIPKERPRWRSAQLFNQAVEEYLSTEKDRYDIIHTHERTATKHVATLHGPPFAHTRSFPLHKKLSPSYFMNHRLEQQQLLFPEDLNLICVSELLREEALHHYPALRNRKTHVIMPGAVRHKAETQKRTSRPKTIGFLGREWKRKGLLFALEVWEESKVDIPDLKFLSAGFDGKEHPLGINLPEGCAHKGWIDEVDEFFAEIDLLIHPARAEPFGMVILEALQRGIPVLISDKCGASSLVTPQNGIVHPLSHPSIEWVNSALALLSASSIESLSRPWHDVAMEHLDLYKALA